MKIFYHLICGKFLSLIVGGVRSRDPHVAGKDFKRAGCDGILTYFAVEMAEILADRA